MEIIANKIVNDDGYVENIYYISDGVGKFLSKEFNSTNKFNTKDLSEILDIELENYIFVYDKYAISDDDVILFKFETLTDHHTEFFI